YGDGTLILSAKNTYTGDTTVHAGTLKLTDTGKLTNDAVTVKDGGTFDLSGELVTRNISIESGAFFNITGTTLTVTGLLDIQSGGTLDLVDHHERLLNLGASSQLNNNGLIIMNHADKFVTNGSNTLQVEKLSGNNGKVQMYVNIAANESDQIIVAGTATGTHRLLLTNLGNDPTGKEPALLLAQTGQSESTDTFTGDYSSGILHYVVREGRHVDGGKVNNFYLVLSNLCGTSCNYVAAQRVNAETGFQQLANLHQRVGDHRELPLELQSWARTYYHQGSEDGKRHFGHEQDTTGIQIGRELLAKSTGNGGTIRAAIAFDYAHTDADFNDRARPAEGLQRGTGSMKSESHALGGYFTHTTANGAYVNFVGQAAKLESKFTTKTRTPYDKTTQKGWRAGLSVEGGVPLWKIDNAWLLEGQTQLSYQYTKYQSFKDNTCKVGQYDAETLRGRIGARLVRDLTTAENKSLKLYGLVNVYRDFFKPEGVPIGQSDGTNVTRISERYGKSWGELGIGIQGWANKSTSVFGDLRYQHGFSSHDKGDAREGGSVNVGARFGF
ncbi:MAG: autotransporter outer membrane beta-barrel domain-containing protein, partial [Candidatus Accumulibacter sp.]|nr:autotransporter outer membrane beta-barrel domain-containing protein [Accumulibacter sp.]